MRIYTEVIFEWDDKQNQLVETSSESFDYEGEMALCGWEAGSMFYDAAGNQWKSEIKIFKRRVTKQIFFKNGVQAEVRERGGGTRQGALDNFKEYVTGQVKDYKNTKLYTQEQFDAGDVGKAWEVEFPGQVWDDTMSGDQRQKYLTGGQKFVETGEGAQTMLHADYLELSEDDKSKWQMNLETGKYDLVIEQQWGDQAKKDEKVQEAENVIQGHIDRWLAITQTDIPDQFQTELREATEAIEHEETAIETAYHDFFDPGGTLETIAEDYEIEKGITTGQYTTDVERLLGEAVYDPITNELISEGTYTAEKRLLEEGKEEAEEDVFLGREEELEALREEAGGEIRAAEAKIGAAGFAATGVGRTAREVLAEEIGEEAQDIEAGFTADREDIAEGYLTDIGEIEKRKTIAMKDYETGQDTALGRYKRAAKASAKTGAAPWKAATESYEDLLALYGTFDSETGRATGGRLETIQSEAEAELQSIQRDIEFKLADIQDPLFDMGEWDPFEAGGVFETTGIEMGWDPWTGKFDPEKAKGMFGTTMQEQLYGDPVTPGLEGMMYTPEYALPWEEDEGGGGGGVPDIGGSGY